MTRQQGLISVIICSAGRRESLDATLASLQLVSIPKDFAAELLVIDNNPKPAYQDALNGLDPKWSPKYVHEPTRGLSAARNRGLKDSAGEIIVFTDDDLRFELDFLIELVRPIVEGVADAAAGSIKLAPHLEEPWMEPWHRIAFASTEHLDMNDPKGFVGANFAFHSRVLKDVPGFDEELGAGKLGTGEETVFAMQLVKAGYKIAGAPKSVVWHHFDPSRKSRESLIKASEAWGRANAHIDANYGGVPVGMPGLHAWKAALQLRLHRLRHKRGDSPMDVKESTLIKNVAYYRAMAGK